MRRETKTWLGRLGLAALLAAALGYVPYHLYARSGFARMREHRRQLDAMRAANERLRAENARLFQEAESLRSDLGAIERAARSDLGWVRPGEVVFQILPASTTGIRP